MVASSPSTGKSRYSTVMIYGHVQSVRPKRMASTRMSGRGNRRAPHPYASSIRRNFTRPEAMLPFIIEGLTVLSKWSPVRDVALEQIRPRASCVLPCRSKVTIPASAQISLEADSVDDLLPCLRARIQHGWTDGLPIIPRRLRVAEFVAASGHQT